MFGLFKRKKVRTVTAPNSVYMSREIADEALIATAAASEYPVIVASFFKDSLDRLEVKLREADVEATRLEHFGYGGNGPKDAPLLLHAGRGVDDTEFERWLQGADAEFLFLFVEHFPLLSVEEKLLDVLERAQERRMQRAMFFTGLDEPLMVAFGGDRLIQLMHSLGMGPSERISHSMVDSAIANACKKVEKKVRLPKPADSDAEWFAVNLSGQ